MKAMDVLAGDHRQRFLVSDHSVMTCTREALLSEAGFENVFRTQNWARRRKLFCR